MVSQEVHVERRCENHLLIFTAGSKKVGGVLFVVDVVGGRRLKGNGKGRRICKIVVDVAGGKKKKKEVGYDENELGIGETIRKKKDGNEKIDNTTMKKDCNCH